MPRVECQTTEALSGQNSNSTSPPTGAGPAWMTVRNRVGSSVASMSITPWASAGSRRRSESLLNASAGVAATSTFCSIFTVPASADDGPAPPRRHLVELLLHRGENLVVTLAHVFVVGRRLRSVALELHRRQRLDLNLCRQQDAGQKVGGIQAPGRCELDRGGLDAEAAVEAQEPAKPLPIRQKDARLVAADVDHRNQGHAVHQRRPDETHASCKLDYIALRPGTVGLNVPAGINQDAGTALQRFIRILACGRDGAEGAQKTADHREGHCRRVRQRVERSLSTEVGGEGHAEDERIGDVVAAAVIADQERGADLGNVLETVDAGPEVGAGNEPGEGQVLANVVRVALLEAAAGQAVEDAASKAVGRERVGAPVIILTDEVIEVLLLRCGAVTRHAAARRLQRLCRASSSVSPPRVAPRATWPARGRIAASTCSCLPRHRAGERWKAAAGLGEPGGRGAEPGGGADRVESAIAAWPAIAPAFSSSHLVPPSPWLPIRPDLRQFWKSGL